MSPRRPLLRSITTRREAVRVFVSHPSPRVLGAALATAFVVRARGRRPDPVDALVLGAVVGAQGAHEWVIHRGLLHARPRTLAGHRLDPGAGHRAHHDDPEIVEHALLGAPEAAVFSASVAAWVALLCIPWRHRLAPRHVATAVVAAEAGLLAYEWRHFVDHTSVPLRLARARRLRVHHRRHHHADDTRWFGITATSGDRAHELAVRVAQAVRG